MSDFLNRLKEEKAQLYERKTKLESFIGSDKFIQIDDVQQTLLNIQVQAMATYSQCLLERIARLEPVMA